ncbi:MAG: DUF1592 domain-containing protein [Bryobacteraceae bacterium]|nr:DUF1592 domain-containing protein [Bryobacteraceae bacterium]
MRRLLTTTSLAFTLLGSTVAAAAPPTAEAPPFKQYCFGCHGKASAAAGINLEQLTAHDAVGEDFQKWLKVAEVLEQKRMPPPKMKQPTDEQRSGSVQWIRTRLGDYAKQHAGDPGRVTVRRLTSAEYVNSINDLTGLDLRFDSEFAGDSVGGEGFTNFGDVQFMADANLERYLEAARKVADHAVLGSGPLQFFQDPGRSGFELSAVHRIQKIYTTYGFKANSAEGGLPYGQERYSKAFYAAWRYKHRNVFGEPKATPESIAAREGISPKLARHILTQMSTNAPTYPASLIVAKFNALPVPTAATKDAADAEARKGASDVHVTILNWVRNLFAAGAIAAGGQGDERTFELTEETLKAETRHKFRYPIGGLGRRDTTKARAFFSLLDVNPDAKDTPIVIWHKPTVRLRGKDRATGEPQPLKSVLSEAAIAKLNFGKTPDGKDIDPDSFALQGNSSTSFEFDLPADKLGAELNVEAELLAGAANDVVLRCVISNQEDVTKGRPIFKLLAHPAGAGYAAWKKHVLEFGANLPQNSQGEPTPADRDPIPPPYLNTYNQPERDEFHTKVKYFRDDKFFLLHVVDDVHRKLLDQAWNDLYASFEYHNAILRFTAKKYKFDLKGKSIEDLTDADVEAVPAEPRKFVRALYTDYNAVEKTQIEARPRHLNDAIDFASKAWRRPLTQSEKDRLRAFYTNATEKQKLDHGKAIELLLARVLVSPAFLYKLEQPSRDASAKQLTDWELASRLSYFLWSSVPDNELRRAATAGELNQPEQLAKQVKRMLSDVKARRFSTEFFGQWLGFYRFDQSTGVDTTRFPEFTQEVKDGMYDEAVYFFDHIVRNRRPAREILTANYTFLTQPLAKHYGVKKEVKAKNDPELVENAAEFNRGGMLRLGAILTATSAPLRTSPVKRGDWMLRRVLGTPTPPPPPDAGSIPADDKLFAGATVRQKLDAHKRNATCAACHTRIDPLGFPLERFDSTGRWRETYGDGKAIDDVATFADNTEIKGVDGLLDYLKKQEPQVMRNMSWKLVGFALGRTVTASDLPLIDKMAQSGGDATFEQLTTEIVTSKQFRYRREPDQPAPPPRENVAKQTQRPQPAKEGGE